MHSAASLKRIGMAWLSGSRMWYRPPYTFFAASAANTAARSAVAHSVVTLRLPKWAAWQSRSSSQPLIADSVISADSDVLARRNKHTVSMLAQLVKASLAVCGRQRCSSRGENVKPLQWLALLRSALELRRVLSLWLHV